MKKVEKAEEVWTITKALASAMEVGVVLSRPTIISMCKQKNVGYQTNDRGKWRIYSTKFMKLIQGENND